MHDKIRARLLNQIVDWADKGGVNAALDRLETMKLPEAEYLELVQAFTEQTKKLRSKRTHGPEH